ncbi:MAG TPA: APC family permease [Leifsonia sp.]|jgi:APA family basic amino acid/polyamine antiporter
MTAQPSLLRRIGLADAVFIGLGSMIGAGVFAAFSPAARAAGSGLLIGLVIAAVVAYCNASSSAQLAAAHPVSGGTYAYGRAELGEWPGFVAGWCFVIGKTASCAAMALTFAAYAAPPGWERAVGIAAVVALVAVNSFGITRTAQLTRVIVVVSLLGLAIAVAAGSSAIAGGGSAGGSAFSASALLENGWYGILQAGGLLFFAFAGYARIATMGEEVRDPRRTIPRAITIALAATVVVYAVVAVVVLGTLGPLGTAATDAPVAATAAASGWSWAVPVVRVAAAAASLGALLALIAGIGRTSLAMAREGDLPRALAVVHPRWRVPRRAEFAVGAVVMLLVAFTDLRGAIAFSSFGVLIYYFIANASALHQGGTQRRYPRWLQVLGMLGCAVLVVTLPPAGIVVGVAVVVVGVLYRLVVRARLRRT